MPYLVSTSDASCVAIFGLKEVKCRGEVLNVVAEIPWVMVAEMLEAHPLYVFEGENLLYRPGFKNRLMFPDVTG